jgi:hypothetical protein
MMEQATNLKSVVADVIPNPYAKILDADHIRLLRIDSIDHDGTFRCCFNVKNATNLDIRYYAISYTWGLESNEENYIIVDDCKVAVQPNFIIMLKGIHELLIQGGKQNSFIWADGVCINQSSKLEKEIQLKAMERLYRNAEEVMIWLGEADEESDKAMTVMQWLNHRATSLSNQLPSTEFPIPAPEVLEAICRSRYDISKDVLYQILAMFEGTDQQLLETVVQDRQVEFGRRQEKYPDLILHNHPFWKAWETLSKRAWFYRIWVVQEFLLASSALFICGKKHIDWQVLEYTTRQGLQSRFSSEAMDFARNFNAIGLLMHLKVGLVKKVDAGETPSFSLSFLMSTNKNRGAKASKPHDYVYGVMGLLNSYARSLIPVDYDLDPSEILLHTLWSALLQGTPASAVATRWEFNGLGPRTVGPMSWFPFSIEEEWLSNELWMFPITHEKASEGLDKAITDGARMRRGPQNYIASLDAFHVDTITKVASSPYTVSRRFFDEKTNPGEYDGEILSQSGSDWLSNIEELLSGRAILSAHSATTNPCEDDLSSPKGEHLDIDSTQLADSSMRRELFLRDLFSFEPLSELDTKIQAGLFDQIRQFISKYKGTHVPMNTVIALLGLSSHNRETFVHGLQSLTQMCNSSYCTTSSGKFGRCASKEVKPGDVICFIPGGGRLHIFRPIEERNTYQRITTAWFTGWSFGEAVALANSATLALTTFDIE